METAQEKRERRKALSKARKLVLKVNDLKSLSSLQAEAFREEEKRRKKINKGVLRVFLRSAAGLGTKSKQQIALKSMQMQISLGFKAPTLPKTTHYSRLFLGDAFVGEDFAFPVVNASVQRLKVQVLGTTADSVSAKHASTAVNLGYVEMFVKDIRAIESGILRKQFKLHGHEAIDGASLDLEMVLTPSSGHPGLDMPM